MWFCIQMVSIDMDLVFKIMCFILYSKGNKKMEDLHLGGA